MENFENCICVCVCVCVCVYMHVHMHAINLDEILLNITKDIFLLNYFPENKSEAYEITMLSACPSVSPVINLN